jgi:predicted AAA+ superfamily ATPase
MIIMHAMNDLPYLPRLLAPLVTRAMKTSPVVVVTGARQTGKSTLVQRLASDLTYLTLDDVEILDRAQREPDALLRPPGLLVIDQIQRSPDLLLAVKRAVDTRRRAGRFVLTGSANLLLMKRVSETLAGRVVHVSLWPLTRREQLGRPEPGLWSLLFATPEKNWMDLLRDGTAPREDWRALARRGGYPGPAHQLASADARRQWFAGYTQTYLERDLRDLSAVASLPDFRRLMRATCLRIGNLVNTTELGRDTGLPQPTVHRHLSLMEISYQLVRVPAYAVNRTKRIIKTPKLYWSDTGLALFLAGESEPQGAHLENLVLSDLVAWRGSELEAPEILYWRTSTGEEVDFVVEWQGRLLPVEVKSSKRPRLDDCKSIAIFRQEYGRQALPGLVLHDGSETTWLADGVLATPWWRVI